VTVTLGILLALACAVIANLGNLMKHRGCCQTAAVDMRHPLRTAIGLWSKRSFALGMLAGGVAWILHVGAISLAPLSLVQIVLAGGVVLISVMAERMFGLPVDRRQRWGLVLTAAGLILLVVSMPRVDGDSHTFSLITMTLFEAALFSAGVLLMLGSRAGLRDEHHAIALAVATGMLFGVCNVAVKALSGLVEHGGAPALLSPWLLVAAAASCLAFFASARSLQVGGAVEVIAVTGTAANVVTIAGGILVFQDPVPSDPLGVAVQACAFLLVIVASALIPGARQPAAAAAS
jgi:hypothetical protein